MKKTLSRQIFFMKNVFCYDSPHKRKRDPLVDKYIRHRSHCRTECCPQGQPSRLASRHFGYDVFFHRIRRSRSLTVAKIFISSCDYTKVVVSNSALHHKLLDTHENQLANIKCLPGHIMVNDMCRS